MKRQKCWVPKKVSNAGLCQWKTIYIYYQKVLGLFLFLFRLQIISFQIFDLYDQEKKGVLGKEEVYIIHFHFNASVDVLAKNIQTFFLIKLEEMAMALDQLMGEGGTKLTVANRCQGNWKKLMFSLNLIDWWKMIDWCFLWWSDWAIFKKMVLPQDCPLCSSTLDLMVGMSWIGRTGWKGVKISYNLSDSF